MNNNSKSTKITHKGAGVDLEKNEDSLRKYMEMIRNSPVSCTYCGAKHHPGDIQYIEVYPGKNEHVCNIDCAIGFCNKEIRCHESIVLILEKQLKLLLKQKEVK